MNNLIFYNKSENADENSYLYFQLGENKYAIKVQQIVEIMKLPMLDYPQKLSNNAVGLLKYDNFIIIAVYKLFNKSVFRITKPPITCTMFRKY